MILVTDMFKLFSYTFVYTLVRMSPKHTGCLYSSIIQENMFFRGQYIFHIQLFYSNEQFYKYALSFVFFYKNALILLMLFLINNNIFFIWKIWYLCFAFFICWNKYTMNGIRRMWLLFHQKYHRHTLKSLT